MIGYLPTSLTVQGTEYDINPDFRIALLIFEALDDPELTDNDRASVLLECLYCSPKSIPYEALNEAVQRGSWFLDGGKDYGEPHSNANGAKTISWTQDEQLIFAAVNKAAGRELRVPNTPLHWWTFLGYFSEIGECTLSTVISIRDKRNKHKSLDRVEKEFYKTHKDIIDIKKKRSAAEQAERDRLNALLG